MFDSPGNPPLGLSVGATAIAASYAGRTAVHACEATVGGQRLTGFVDRVGDPVPLVAADGSEHRAEALLAVALDTAAASVTGGAPFGDLAISVPAHWRPSVVETLRHTVPGATLVSDATAALAELNANPGLPTRGVVVLCDMGGSATNITLVNASSNHALVGETVRVAELSGDHIDQALLSHVASGLDVDPSMVDVLATLRTECRAAKERLSSDTATAVPVHLPGRHTEFRVTRRELDELAEPFVANFLAALDDTLDRYGVPAAGISAVATVGGGARIPLLTRRLSEHLRAPVATTAQPHLTAVQGAVQLAQRARVVDVATTIAPSVIPATTVIDMASTATVPAALAWSADETELPYARPELEFRRDEPIEGPPRRAPIVLFALSATAAALTAAVFGLMQLAGGTTPVEAATSTTVAPSPAPAAPAPSPALPAPQATTVTTVVTPAPRIAPRPHVAPVTQAPAPQAPAPSPAAPPPPPPTTWTPPAWTPPTWIPPWRRPHTPPAEPPSEPPADPPPPSQSDGGGTDTGTPPAQPDGGTDSAPGDPGTGGTGS